jgi:hypothetical protein
MNSPETIADNIIYFGTKYNPNRYEVKEHDFTRTQIDDAKADMVDRLLANPKYLMDTVFNGDKDDFNVPETHQFFNILAMILSGKREDLSNNLEDMRALFSRKYDKTAEQMALAYLAENEVEEF